MNISLSKLLSSLNFDSKLYAIDVGAHYGEYTKYLITTGFFNHVVSFEPNPESYASLTSQVTSVTNCTYECIHSALSDQSGSLDLYCDNNTATASLLPYDSSYKGFGQIKKHVVPVVTLDEYLAKNPKVGRLQLIKIDTQGNDLSVLKGGIHSIKTHRPIIQTEFIYISLYEGQCNPIELTEFLCSLGYEIYSLNNLHITEEGRLAFCDAIFVPKELSIPVTQKYSCIDDQLSYTTQINTLTQICAERLTAINLLDAEVQRLRQSHT